MISPDKKFDIASLHDETYSQVVRDNEILANENIFFNYLLKNNPSVLYITSLGRKKECRFISENIHNLLGYNQEEMTNNKFWISHIHPDDRQATLKKIQHSLYQGRGCIQYRFISSKNIYRWILDQHRIIFKDDIPVEIIGSWTDITDERNLNPDLNYYIYHDLLTGLVNRRTLQDRIDAIERMKYFGEDHVLCYLDIDQFKVINTTYGHDAGDALLRQLSEIIKSILGKKDTLARLDGDEFGILLEYCTLEQAQRILNDIQDAIHEFRFAWEDKKLAITTSIGVVAMNNNIYVHRSFLSMAYTACYAAKEAGRNRIRVYCGTSNDLSERQKEMHFVEHINRALEEDRFILYYQPIVSLDDNSQDNHYEILIRMKDDNGNLVLPGAFLLPAERYNLSAKIDRWVIQTIFSWLEAYSEDLADSNCSWGINLSGQSLADDALLEFVVYEIERKQIPAKKVYFEVTETAAIANLNNALKFISTLKELGCRFALDDFGSGLSSFSYLKNIPVDFLKIDGVFIKNMASDTTDYAMVRAIHDVARHMGKKTIAEFVENDEIIIKLKEIGVNYAQGYGIGKPMPLTGFNMQLNIH